MGRNFNVFEGARRVATATAAVISLAYLILVYIGQPTSAGLYYSVDVGTGIPRLVDACGSTDMTKYIDLRRTKISFVVLCFPFKLIGESDAIPKSKVPDANKQWKEPPKIHSYDNPERYAASFALPRSADADINAKLRKETIDQWKTAILTLAVGLIIWYIFTYIIGWIARGFLGIPSGKDSV